MKKFWFLLVMLFFLTTASNQASALTLTLEPPLNTITVGDIVGVDLVISGLGANGPPSVQSFDIDLHWDVDILTLDSVVFGAFLGVPDTDFSGASSNSTETEIASNTFGDGNDPEPDGLWVAENSLLTASALDALQPAIFSLVTVNFLSTSSGSSYINGFVYWVDDAEGNELFGFSDSPSSAEINVNPVPEPATMLLLGSGLIGLAAFRKKFKKR